MDENRVIKIRSLVGTECGCFVPGEVNPADLSTRHNFINHVMIKRWTEFLLKPEDNWPVQKDIHGVPSRVTLEEAKKSSLDDEKVAIISESTTANIVVSDDSIQYVNIQDVININKFNSFQRLCKVTAYVFRFIGNLKNSIIKKELILDPEVTINELNYSECLWLKFVPKELISNNSKYEKLRSSL